MVDITVGVSLNNLAGHYGLGDLIKAAQRAEELGFDAVWLHDAPLGRRTVAAWDPISVITAVGRETERVKLATGVFQPHLRNPVAVAQAWATADYLSGGRTIMGVGTGAGKSRLVDREYQALAALRPGGETPNPEQLYKRRRRLFLESVHVIRRLWDEDKVTHHGEFFHLDEVTLGLAKPLQKPHPPIVIGAGHYIPAEMGGSVHHIWNPERAGKWLPGPLDKVGELGDGWITVQVTPEEYAAARDQVLASRGGHASDFTLAFNCFVNVNEDASVGLNEIGQHLNDFHGPPVPRDLVERWGVSGTAERIANRLAEYVEQGVTLFQLVVGSPDEFGQMARLANEMLPALRARAASVSARS
jgi:alkanesulfonate monooxygenase SsuD/methylene tetrahydromethanopterin reductase-like flavin-dependent oxidoreductase (luciferase family)